MQNDDGMFVNIVGFEHPKVMMAFQFLCAKPLIDTSFVRIDVDEEREIHHLWQRKVVAVDGRRRVHRVPIRSEVIKNTVELLRETADQLEAFDEKIGSKLSVGTNVVTWLYGDWMVYIKRRFNNHHSTMFHQMLRQRFRSIEGYRVPDKLIYCRLSEQMVKEVLVHRTPAKFDDAEWRFVRRIGRELDAKAEKAGGKCLTIEVDEETKSHELAETFKNTLREMGFR